MENIDKSFQDKKVLIVEDNQMNRELAAFIFASLGFFVEEAENGKEALEKINFGANCFDLICMDIHMPVMDGYEAAGIIRTTIDSSKTKIPIFAMTADRNNEIDERIKACGMNEVILKPFDIKDIYNKLKKIFG
ncbi:MAG: response regulator [Lachnospiraceae bacterium]